MNSILIVLPILTVLMFDLGLTLKLSDFVTVFRYPKAMILGLSGQLLLLPLIALALGTVFNLPPLFFIGLVLIACCPGGSSSNVFSKIAGGDVALSVSLTAVSSLVTLVTLPIIMNYTTLRLGETVGVTLPVANLLKQNLLTMLLPIALGIALRYWKEGVALKIDKVLSKVAFPALMLLAAIFFIQNKGAIIANFKVLGLSTGSLIISAILVAAVLGRIIRLDNRQQRTINIEVGMQNAAQAIAVATSPFVFNNSEIATPAIIYALLMNLVLLTYVALIPKQK
ncbi:MAG: bile acid:sodium symporter family protein [Bacteroidales bacterium]|nr:bile acid:sodium symporter family protein [Bacteroidales bacterium]